MSKLVENYIAVNEGKMAKSEFLRQARQSLPGYITQFTSFEDAVQIFKNKGILTEDIVYRNLGDKFPLESIEKGIEYELALAGVEDLDNPTSVEYKRAKEKVIENLCKDSLYYFYKMSSPENKEIKKKQNLQEAATENVDMLNKAFLELYVKYKDGNYKVKDKETGELKDGKKLAPETAAQKACMRVRQAYNAPRFRPDRNTIKSCSVGRGKLEYQGESNGIPRFNYAWSLHELSKNSGDPIWTQFYNFYKKQGKSDHEAKILANDKLKKYNVKKMQESQKIGNDLLKEAITNSIKRVLTEAATANLAQLSDQNASIQGIPAILNSLENVVTEIESFIIKEQTKIQGIFDSLGNVKNEDNVPIGYKFVGPTLASFKRDLEPVLAKINLDDLNLPAAPETEESPVQQDIENPAEPSVEDKETVFSPKAPESAPLAESTKKRGRYTIL